MNRVLLPYGAAFFAVFFLAGCITTEHEAARQFEPVPVAKVRTQELTPVSPRSVTEVLRQAQEAFELANQAQEQNDTPAALGHYTHMLELMTEADLDPSVFYNLRNEFQRILDNSEQQAYLFERRKAWQQGGPNQMVVGDLPIEFPLPEPVLKEIEEIQHNYGAHFQAGLDRSFKYLPHIRAELARAGLPMDLAWLAMLESQFHPKAVSRAGAKGMWQFMRTTARNHHLRIDSYVDERYNWQAATRAAALYLGQLHERFEYSWPLAISAYNMGEHGLERAIASAGGERDLWQLIDGSRRMHRETKKFYPKLVATILVAKNPEKFGFTLNPQPPEETVRVPIKGSYSLAMLDKQCDLPSGTLRQLNPELIRGATPPGDTYHLAVPPAAREKLLAALRTSPKLNPELLLDGAGTYTVKRGDTPSGIAKKLHVSTKELMAVNNIRSARHLMPGKKLVIPGYTPARSARLPGSASSVAGGGSVYTVRKGDTLSEIAKANKVSVQDLLRWNNKSGPMIGVGEKLYVAPVVAAGGDQDSAEIVHIVRAGEFPDKIAKQYGVGLEDLLRWNNLTRASIIHVGDKLAVRGAPPAAATGRPQAARKRAHTVSKGESASVIANKYHVRTSEFLAWNNLTAKSILQVGDQCVVYLPASGAGDGNGSALQQASETATSGNAKKVTHVVRSGENPTTIASRHGVKVSDLLEWNDWDKKVVLQIGQKVTVYAD